MNYWYINIEIRVIFMVLLWEDEYRNIYKKRGWAEKSIESGILDFKQRFSFIFNVLKKHNVSKSAKISDFGCGVGMSGRILNKNGYHNLIGYEIDARDIQHAKDAYDYFYRQDCDSIKLEDSSIDVALVLNVIEHLKDPHGFLKRVNGALTENGIIFLSLPNTTFLRGVFGKNLICPEHLSYWSYDEFRKVLSDNGFIPRDGKPIGNIPLLTLCQTFIIYATKK